MVRLGDTEIVVTAKDIVYNGEWMIMSLIILYGNKTMPSLALAYTCRSI